MRSDNTAAVLVFDLDETILRVNSFPLWVRYLVAGRIPGLSFPRRAELSLRVLWLVLARKSGLIDHGILLQRLQRVWRRMTGGNGETMAGALQTSLMRNVRANLWPLLTVVGAGRVDALLATAAASDYAVGLGQRLGFRHVLATSSDGGVMAPRNSGTQKRDRVLALLRQLGWQTRPLVLFTDHIEELPLIRECHVVCWFGSTATLAVAEAETDGPRFIACRDLTADELETALHRLGGLPQTARLSAITAS